MADRVRMNAVALSTTALAQGPSFWHAGTDLLRSKSLDRNSYNSGDWFNRIDWSDEDSTWGSGLPPRERQRGPSGTFMRPLLADPALEPRPADIRAARDRARRAAAHPLLVAAVPARQRARDPAARELPDRRPEPDPGRHRAWRSTAASWSSSTRRRARPRRRSRPRRARCTRCRRAAATGGAGDRRRRPVERPSSRRTAKPPRARSPASGGSRGPARRHRRTGRTSSVFVDRTQARFTPVRTRLITFRASTRRCRSRASQPARGRSSSRPRVAHLAQGRVGSVCDGSDLPRHPSLPIVSSTTPASLASPFHDDGSSEPLWSANRGSRWRSRALRACHIEPISSSPSSNRVSMPEMRGEPSRRTVAMVLWVCASRRSRTRAASSGAAASNSDQLGMPASCRTDGAASSRTSKSIKLCAWPTACAS